MVVCVGLAAACIALWPEVPAWNNGGSNSLGAHSLTSVRGPLPCPRAGTRIAIFGDSHVAGRRKDSAAGDELAFGDVLRTVLNETVSVERYGIGGHTADMGATHWLDRDIKADIVFIAYGTNDAAPRGWLSNRRAVPLPVFKAKLAQHVDHWISTGAASILILPPPGGSRAIGRRLEPYRQAVAQMSAERNITVLDPAEAFAECSADEPLLTTDALHLNGDGHRCLGRWLARKLCPANARPSQE